MLSERVKRQCTFNLSAEETTAQAQAHATTSGIYQEAFGQDQAQVGAKRGFFGCIARPYPEHGVANAVQVRRREQQDQLQ